MRLTNMRRTERGNGEIVLEGTRSNGRPWRTVLRRYPRTVNHCPLCRLYHTPAAYGAWQREYPSGRWVRHCQNTHCRHRQVFIPVEKLIS